MTPEQLQEIAANGIHMSAVSIRSWWRRCIAGWKEIEFEVMRDGAGQRHHHLLAWRTSTPWASTPVTPSSSRPRRRWPTGNTRCSAPPRWTSSRELEIEGGCNVQFALDPDSFEYAVIEVNPRVSRSSRRWPPRPRATPSPRVAAKIALGYTLDEIPNAVTGKTCACFEPMLDYCVVKIPKWPFDKFTTASPDAGHADEGHRRGHGHRQLLRGWR